MWELRWAFLPWASSGAWLESFDLRFGQDIPATYPGPQAALFAHLPDPALGAPKDSGSLGGAEHLHRHHSIIPTHPKREHYLVDPSGGRHIILLKGSIC